MANLFSINILVELFGVLIAFVCLRNDQVSVWRYQILYLLMVSITEVSGRYLIIMIHRDNNSWLYNLLLIAEATAIIGMFYRLFSDFKKSMSVIFYGLAFFIITYLLDLYNHGFHQFNSICDTTMSVYYCFCGLYYYYHLLREDNYYNLARLASFWWVAGTLLFYFGNITCDLFFSKLIIIHHLKLRYNIVMVLNLILYLTWSYAFVCRYQQQKLAR